MKSATQHQTLYRAYRPSSFDEVRGQAQVTDVLQAAIKNKKIAHAYLFAGSRGTGKTSVARILAREIGVSDKDLYEIDAASNRGINEIRELRESVNTMPFESPYKFYIIDEAHMLTKDAWNAFLKTLEEPPPHVIFVMATTERDKVPDTIQSRCEIYTFKQPNREILAEIVTDVAKKEGHTLERGAAELVAMLADGSFRDALSILQKVLTVSRDKKIDVAEVLKVTGAPKNEIVRQILGSLSHKDVAAALAALQGAVKDNVDMRVLARLLIHRLRIALLLRYAPDIAEMLAHELSADDMAFVQGLSKLPAVNSEMLRALLEAHATMAYAAIPHLPLELAIVDVCNKDVSSNDA
ncbi:MAG TPA: DNA polymerase III subunit gamma/tau [Candidatus Paceibacterota bacterium]|nr:DNA polymerase III subunit gamma/tau [Candidatus Paceibacterota bacterium]